MAGEIIGTSDAPRWLQRLGHFIDHFNPGRFLLWKINFAVVTYTAIVCLIDNHDIKGTKFVELNGAMLLSAVIGLLCYWQNKSGPLWWKWQSKMLPLEDR